jgi:hypothetical protein
MILNCREGRPRQAAPSTALSDTTTTKVLNWRDAEVGPPKPCAICRRPALLRDPVSGRPMHKVCAERRTDRRKRVTRNKARHVTADVTGRVTGDGR